MAVTQNRPALAFTAWLIHRRTPVAHPSRAELARSLRKVSNKVLVGLIVFELRL